MSFLPEGYKEPSVSRYMKLEEGENKFRVLGSAVTGWEYWKTNDKGERRPVRIHSNQTVPASELELNPKTGEVDMPKFFWAFPVFNYQDSAVEILELTQKTIRSTITGFINNPKWGDPKEYDLTVNKIKEGGKTSYSVMPDPKEPIDELILEMYSKMHINLEALFDGGDPFAPTSDKSEHVDPEEVESGLERLRKAVPTK